jgi:hypothetical protein
MGNLQMDNNHNESTTDCFDFVENLQQTEQTHDPVLCEHLGRIYGD